MVRDPEHYDDVLRSPLGHRLMFVLLTMLSFALFTPTAMLPKVRQYGELVQEEGKLKRRVAELNDEVRHRAELAEAFAHDAGVNERLAVLDLGYRKPNEEVYAVLADESLPAAESPPAVGSPPRTALLIPDDWPEYAINAEIWANDHGFIDLFLDENMRPVFLFMSGGLLVAAFVLFAPRLPRQALAKKTPKFVAASHRPIHAAG